ncbi:unnamed protein product [Leuciscus chuanchicus]
MAASYNWFSGEDNGQIRAAYIQYLSHSASSVLCKSAKIEKTNTNLSHVYSFVNTFEYRRDAENALVALNYSDLKPVRIMPRDCDRECSPGLQCKAEPNFHQAGQTNWQPASIGHIQPKRISEGYTSSRVQQIKIYPVMKASTKHEGEED